MIIVMINDDVDDDHDHDHYDDDDDTHSDLKEKHAGHKS